MIVSIVVAIILGIYGTGHWLGGAAVATGILIWTVLRAREGPPILAMALTYQLSQVSIGLFYVAATGDTLDAMVHSDWQRMMLLGLINIVCLTAGITAGRALIAQRFDYPRDAPRIAFTTQVLLIAYVVSIVVTATVQQVAWQYSGLTQAILALSFSKLAVLYLLLRRFMQPVFRWQWIAVLLGVEVLLGFSGYFAGFREPLVMAAIAIRHWALFGVVGAVLLSTSIFWMAVRRDYREELDDTLVNATRVERLERMQALSQGMVGSYLEPLHQLVDRMWVIYYPALALDRVPNQVQHTDGRLIGDALMHLVTPRLLFPEKAPLQSDSEMVREYAGRNVAGAETGTSIAFGYLAESYVDFGVPWMFIPVLIYAVFVGMAYEVLLRAITYRELAISLVTVIFWLTLYLFERSWVKTLGLNLTLLAYLGGSAWILDRYLLGRRGELADQRLGTDPAFHTR
jgi:hypothetical protein